jgi:hypothetical protein
LQPHPKRLRTALDHGIQGHAPDVPDLAAQLQPHPKRLRTALAHGIQGHAPDVADLAAQSQPHPKRLRTSLAHGIQAQPPTVEARPSRFDAPLTAAQQPQAKEPTQPVNALLQHDRRVHDAVERMRGDPTLGTRRAAMLVDLPLGLLERVVDSKGQVFADVEQRLGPVPDEKVAHLGALLDRLRPPQAEPVAPASRPAAPSAASKDKGKAIAVPRPRDGGDSSASM